MAAELKVGIGADNTGLKQGLQDAEKQISAFVTKVGKIGQIGEQLASIGQKMSVGLTLPIVALGGAAVSAYGKLQSLEMGLSATMKSAELAKVEMQKLEEVAKLPGLGMQEAVKGSIRLQAIGMTADKTRNILTQVGNAVASVGDGRAEFERVIYGVQQMANTKFPLGEDLNIIKDALPQVSSLLTEAFGTDRSDEIAKSGITSKQVLDVILEGLTKLPRVEGGITAAFENIGDAIQKNMSKIGKVIDDNFDISGIIEKVSGYLDTLVGYFENLSPSVQKTILVVTGLVAAAGPLLVIVGGFLAALPAMTAGWGAVSLAIANAGGVMGLLMNPITLVTAGIIGIVAAVVSNWSKITPYLVRTANNFIQLYNESQTFRGGVLSIGFAFESLYAIIKSFALSAYNTLKSFGKGVLSLFEGISEMARGFSTGLNNGDWTMFQSGWSKANAKVALSFDDLGARISGVENKYNKLLKNDKPLKFVTEADLNISTDKATTKAAATTASELKKKIEGTPITIELPDFEAIGGSQDLSFIDDFGNKVKNAWNLDDATKSLGGKIASTIGATSAALRAGKEILTIDIESINAEFSEILNNGVIDGIVGAAELMGAALANGGNVVQAAGGALLSTLGGIMVELGQTAIMAGIGIEAIKTALKTLNPGVAIAAGVALVALGGFLKAKVSGMGSSMGGNGGSGSVPSGGGNASQSYSSSFSGAGSGGGPIELRAIVYGQDLLLVTDRARDRNTRLGG